jgi:hypothetical protein
MTITRIWEVDEDVYQVTTEDECGVVSVILFHSKAAFDQFITGSNAHNGSREHTIDYNTSTYAQRRAARSGQGSLLRH